MKEMKFTPRSRLWPEVSTLVEYTLLKRSVRGIPMDASNLVFHGRHCALGVLSGNVSHLFRVTLGYPLEGCVLVEKAISPSLPTAPDDDALERVQQIAFGHAFERLLPDIRSKWPHAGASGWDRSQAPRLVEFCYHVRNGVFHNNRFHLRVTVTPGTAWRDAVIDNSLQGKQVMGFPAGFLGTGDVIALLFDLEATVCGQ